jgi:hypothetical protein
MYSQKNVLQVFVSPLNAPQLALGILLADLAVGEIAFFDVNNDVSIASGEGYFAFNDAGVIKKSNQVRDFDWDVIAYTAPVAHVETLTIPALAIGTEFVLNVKVIAENNNGDETKIASYISKTGDVVADIATNLTAQIAASLAKDGAYAAFTISSSAAVITMTSLPKKFSLGRKLGGYWAFRSSLVKPSEVAVLGTVTIQGTNGIGEGWYVQTKELFARGNSDATSVNHFRTAFPIVLTSTAAGTYNLQGANSIWREFELANNVEGLPRQILLAFDAAGAAPPVIVP